MVELSVGASPAQSPSESPDTLASDTVIASSPEPGHQEDITGMDIETLQDRQYIALETVQELTIKLAQAQSYAWNIAKRIKTMRENPGEILPSTETRPWHGNGTNRLIKPVQSCQHLRGTEITSSCSSPWTSPAAVSKSKTTRAAWHCGSMSFSCKK